MSDQSTTVETANQTAGQDASASLGSVRDLLRTAGCEDVKMQPWDLDALAEQISTHVAAVTMEQFDAFLPSPGLDPAWIAGWHSAVKHVTAVLAKQGSFQNLA